MITYNEYIIEQAKKRGWDGLPLEGEPGPLSGTCYYECNICGAEVHRSPQAVARHEQGKKHIAASAKAYLFLS